MNKYGKILERTYREPNDYTVSGNVVTIYLRDSNKDICGATVVDLDKFHLIKDKVWHLTSTGYAKNDEVWFMHRVLLEVCDSNFIVDHKDGNKLNNLISNIRKCTQQQQNVCNRSLSSKNSSGVSGVHFSSKLNKWIAQIGFKGKTIHLGCFSSIADAKIVRELAEIKYFGEFRKAENSGI